MNQQGQSYEDAACNWLQQQGIVVVERNWQCRMGEIDIIARQAQQLLFVEVRARNSNRFGGAAASITPNKRKKLERTAQLYLQQFTQTPACRFDALLFEQGQWQWLQNIFD
jgi:putative endonuclease